MDYCFLYTRIGEVEGSSEEAGTPQAIYVLEYEVSFSGIRNPILNHEERRPLVADAVVARPLLVEYSFSAAGADLGALNGTSLGY